MAGRDNSDRKRSSNSTSKEFICEPLDELVIPVRTRDGTQKLAPALSIGFMEPRNYVTYNPLPILYLPCNSKCEEAVIEEWMERASFLEADLSWLLKLPYQRFWCQIVYDEKLQSCLQTYLSRAPRDYDLNTSAKEDILSQHKRLQKLVFFVFLRMSTYKETKMHHITDHVFGELIYDNFVFDIPRMMDICVLYGFSNSQIVQKMIQNIFNTQPNYLEDLDECASSLFTTFESIEGRLGLKESVDNAMKGLHRLEETNLSIFDSQPFPELVDFSNYICDIGATVYLFLEAFPIACTTFHKIGILLRMPSFYEVVLPLLEDKFKHYKKIGKSESCVDIILKKLTLSKAFFIKTFRNFVSTNYIHPILTARCDQLDESENVETFLLDNYFQLFTELATNKLFLNDYNYLFPFSADLEIFSEAGISVDSMSLNYILGGLTTPDPNSIASSAKYSTEQNLQKQSKSKDPNNVTSTTLTNGDLACAGAEAAMPGPEDLQATYIHMILDILPGYGEGFLQECLTYYDNSTEQVIDALISENLPPSLMSLPRDMKKKVKGASNTEESVTVLSERRSIFDHDEFDVFNTENVNASKIKRGKSGKTERDYTNLGSDSMSSKLKELTLKYELEIQDEEEAAYERNMYEDEYDDTYDSHPVSLIEPQSECELFKIRPARTPVALRNMKHIKVNNQGEDDEEEEESEEDNTKINEDAKKREEKDEFCMNPEILRQKMEERRQSKMEHRGKFNYNDGNSTKPANVKNKERHKAQIANHNRRKQGDFKRSRGMMPS